MNMGKPLFFAVSLLVAAQSTVSAEEFSTDVSINIGDVQRVNTPVRLLVEMPEKIVPIVPWKRTRFAGLEMKELLTRLLPPPTSNTPLTRPTGPEAPDTLDTLEELDVDDELEEVA